MVKKIILQIIKIYQNFISPNFSKHCRFYPSCSEYTYQSVKTQGIIKGCRKGVFRILKCAPWSPGGVDLP